MLTNKGKYGLKAMMHLARLEPGTVAMVADIAEKNNISKKFLDTILLELRNAGFVRSKKGPGGGYSLARQPREILIGPIIRTLDGPLAPIACASRTAFQPCLDCTDLDACGVRLLMSEVRDAMAKILDNVNLMELILREDLAAAIERGVE
jgi:Rrf2 family protein